MRVSRMENRTHRRIPSIANLHVRADLSPADLRLAWRAQLELLAERIVRGIDIDLEAIMNLIYIRRAARIAGGLE
jgi:hypothetical protein